MENFYDGIVKNLKEEAKQLNENLTKIRTGKLKSRDDNMNYYISTLKSLRETLDLISKYDWKLHYSEYENNGEKQVAVWEQDHSNNIRNHKFWTVEDLKKVSEEIINNTIKRISK